MFNVFIEFPKPIIAAVNGPGIGENLRLLWSLQNICTILLVTFTQEQIYMSGLDEHKNQGLVQQPRHCATLFLPLLAPLSSHLLPGANFILILIAPLWWFLKVMTKFSSFLSWSCYLFASGWQMYQAWCWSWRGGLCQLWKVTNLWTKSHGWPTLE